MGKKEYSADKAHAEKHQRQSDALARGALIADSRKKSALVAAFSALDAEYEQRAAEEKARSKAEKARRLAEEEAACSRAEQDKKVRAPKVPRLNLEMSYEVEANSCPSE